MFYKKIKTIQKAIDNNLGQITTKHRHTAGNLQTVTSTDELGNAVNIGWTGE